MRRGETIKIAVALRRDRRPSPDQKGPMVDAIAIGQRHGTIGTRADKGEPGISSQRFVYQKSTDLFRVDVAP